MGTKDAADMNLTTRADDHEIEIDVGNYWTIYSEDYQKIFRKKYTSPFGLFPGQSVCKCS